MRRISRAAWAAVATLLLGCSSTPKPLPTDLPAPEYEAPRSFDLNPAAAQPSAPAAPPAAPAAPTATAAPGQAPAPKP